MTASTTTLPGCSRNSRFRRRLQTDPRLRALTTMVLSSTWPPVSAAATGGRVAPVDDPIHDGRTLHATSGAPYGCLARGARYPRSGRPKRRSYCPCDQPTTAATPLSGRRGLVEQVAERRCLVLAALLDRRAASVMKALDRTTEPSLARWGRSYSCPSE